MRILTNFILALAFVIAEDLLDPSENISTEESLRVYNPIKIDFEGFYDVIYVNSLPLWPQSDDSKKPCGITDSADGYESILTKPDLSKAKTQSYTMSNQPQTKKNKYSVLSEKFFPAKVLEFDS